MYYDMKIIIIFYLDDVKAGLFDGMNGIAVKISKVYKEWIPIAFGD